ALAQGLVVGPAIWGVVVNLMMYALPGMPGAIAGWIFVLALAAVLVWRCPESIRPRPRVATVFALGTLILFYVALASRQMLGIANDYIRLGLSATIRAGGFPPEFPWNPGAPAPYHYGVNLLVGLLTPPSGPDLAFTTEVIGAYAWVSLFLIVTTILLRRTSGLAVLITVPLVLTVGAWTLRFDAPDGILETVAPTGVPAAGLRAALIDIFWPSAELPYPSILAALPNIWKPNFILSYALALVVLAHAARTSPRSWHSTVTLAALVTFLGFMSTSLAPLVLALWAALEIVHLVRSRPSGSVRRSDVIRSVTGLGLALAAMLVTGGSLANLVFGGDAAPGMSFGGNEYFEGWRLLGGIDRLPGGIGLVGLGPLSVAGAAALFARRDRLVLALTMGAGILLLAMLILNYEPKPRDIVRMEGHARNFALLAFLLSLSVQLTRLRVPRWRFAAAVTIVALVVWPTIAAPVRNMGLAIRRGIEVANAEAASQTGGESFGTRYRLAGFSDRIAAYIRKNTAVDARIFSPDPNQATYVTGRPNAAGLSGLVHISWVKGPQYLDVFRFLEPAAVRRLGFEYIHAPDEWVEGLPDEAAARLDDPSLFELRVRDESESLYRVLPEFLRLTTPPAPESYEALRQAVPPSATVFLSKVFATRDRSRYETARDPIRAAWALSHTRLLGDIYPEMINIRVPWPAKPLSDHRPDLVITPAQFEPWMFPAASRQPIWWNDETAVYALDGMIDPIKSPPPGQPFPFSIRVSDVSGLNGNIAFTATFDNRAPDQW
ncbi:MAG: hypothetical protein OXG22_11510, partial [Chloroflexi bacterium]|nr:hypothetical protein [Chloroflexota bacterium]